MVDDGILGVTSNPTIFQKAIADSDDYDDAIAQPCTGGALGRARCSSSWRSRTCRRPATRSARVRRHRPSGRLRLVRAPAEHGERHGRVGGRARREFWAGSTGPTCSSRSRGRPRASRPSRSRSLPASTSTSRCCSRSSAYDEIHEAFIRGLERRVEQGLPIDDVHSVASFFVSRVDTAVDNQLPDGSPLRGRAAVANAKLAYQRFLGSPATDRWSGAGRQRRARPAPAVGIDGDEEPGVLRRAVRRQPDRPRQVNTMPEGTIAAFSDHGTVRPHGRRRRR